MADQGLKSLNEDFFDEHLANWLLAFSSFFRRRSGALNLAVRLWSLRIKCAHGYVVTTLVVTTRND
jgi:hypothetical protein